VREGRDPGGPRTREGNRNEREQEAEEGGKVGLYLHGAPWVLLAPGAARRLYSFVATYILGYDVYLTTRKMLTGENGEGSNACALPCGVGGVGRGLSEVSAMRKIGIPSLAQTRTLHCICVDTRKCGTIPVALSAKCPPVRAYPSKYR